MQRIDWLMVRLTSVSCSLFIHCLSWMMDITGHVRIKDSRIQKQTDSVEVDYYLSQYSPAILALTFQLMQWRLDRFDLVLFCFAFAMFLTCICCLWICSLYFPWNWTLCHLDSSIQAIATPCMPVCVSLRSSWHHGECTDYTEYARFRRASIRISSHPLLSFVVVFCLCLVLSTK